MLANCTRRMWFMLCSVAQPCNPFGGLELNGTTTRFRRAPLSLIYLSLFLQVIRNPTSLLLCYGLYGIEGIICAWASLHSHSVRWWILLKTESWRELFTTLLFNNHDPTRKRLGRHQFNMLIKSTSMARYLQKTDLLAWEL